jgi:hypothetical protein
MHDNSSQLIERCLYLDDKRTPTEDRFDVVKNYEEFVAYITANGVPKYITFDHDLSEEHMTDYWKQFHDYGFQTPDYKSYKDKTGLDCAQWLVAHVEKNNLPLGLVGVHSYNPIGGENIQLLINGFKKHRGQIPDCFRSCPPFTEADNK